MSSRETSCAIYKSVWEGSKRLSKRAQGGYLRALVAYYFEGEEPNELPEKTSFLWTGNFPRIKRAREVMLSKQIDCTAEPQPKANALCNAPVGARENYCLPAESLAQLPEDVRTEWVGVGAGEGEGAREQTQRCSSQLNFESRLHDASLEARNNDWGIDEEKLAEILERWTLKWFRRGWVDEHGHPMDELVTDRDSPEGKEIPRWASMLRGYLRAIEDRTDESYQERGWS